MEKRTIFLELPSEMIDHIDRINTVGDRSAFITDLLNRQLNTDVSTMNVTQDLTSRMEIEAPSLSDVPGEINITNSKGVHIGKFNINTVEGFEQLAKKICEMSDDPIVRMRARRWL